jgi:uncharacterized damage-inducible protein DinB
MRVQDFIAGTTEWSVDSLYKNARRTPEDKLEWKVLDTGRSILNQIQECAQAPLWSVPLLTEEGPFDFSPETFEAFTAESKQWTTLDDCERHHRENLAKLLAVIREMPDERLGIKIKIPFAEEPVAISDIMMFHYWNNVYHMGQLSFIQTLYGDNDMAF